MGQNPLYHMIGGTDIQLWLRGYDLTRHRLGWWDCFFTGNPYVWWWVWTMVSGEQIFPNQSSEKSSTPHWIIIFLWDNSSVYPITGDGDEVFSRSARLWRRLSRPTLLWPTSWRLGCEILLESHASTYGAEWEWESASGFGGSWHRKLTPVIIPF